MIFDFLGIKINSKAVNGKTIKMNFIFTDTKDKYAVTLENSVLIYSAGKQLKDADVTLTLSKETLNSIVMGTTDFAKAIKDGSVKLSGNAKVLDGFDGYFEKFDPEFNIVTP